MAFITSMPSSVTSFVPPTGKKKRKLQVLVLSISTLASNWSLKICREGALKQFLWTLFLHVFRNTCFWFKGRKDAGFNMQFAIYQDS